MRYLGLASLLALTVVMPVQANDSFPAASWQVHCNTVKCVAFNGGLSLSPTGDGLLVLTTTDGRPARVSLIDGSGTRDLSPLLGRPLSRADLARTLGPAPRLMVERRDKRTDFLSFDMFPQIADALLAGQPAPSEGQHMQMHQGARGALDHTETWQMMPHTKPQIEFAIRAQNGSPVQRRPAP